MELRTPRLVLRDFTPADVTAVRAYQSNPAFLARSRQPAPSEHEVRDFVLRMCRWAAERPRAKYQLAIVLGGVLVGTCGVRRARAGDEEAEYGCELDPAHWGHGYAREASATLLRFAQEALGVRRFVARTSTGNADAIRLAESLGFRCTVPGQYEAVAPLPLD